MDEPIVSPDPEALAKLRAAIDEFITDDAYTDFIPVLIDQVMYSRYPSDDGLNERVNELRLHSLMQQCDRCATQFTSFRMALDFTRLGKHGREHLGYELDDFYRAHVHTERCPENVTGKLNYGPVKLFPTPEGRTETM